MGVPTKEFFFHPGKTQCYSKQAKERVLLGVKKSREETQKGDSQQAIRLKFPEYRTCSPGDTERSGRGDVLNRFVILVFNSRLMIGSDCYAPEDAVALFTN